MTRATAVAVGICALLAPMQAQDEGFDAEAVALAFHARSTEPLDLQQVAEGSAAVRRASGFDRPAAIRAEVARLQGALDAARAPREFVLQINDSISEYDHDAGEFSIQLFTPGYYVPLEAFGRRYQLVFANADRARRVPMPTEEARAFDNRLVRLGRGVVNEIRFTVIGAGDPTGAVTGPLTIRGELVAVRLLDRSGSLLFTPDLATASPAERNASEFDVAAADVAGLRVGVPVADLEATLTRLYGQTKRGGAGSHTYARFAGSLGMNSSGCFSVPGRRGNPRPGSVCIEAQFDDDEIVRAVRIERFFPYFDAELLRAALVRKYGPVAGARGGSAFALGWGPDVQPGQKALTARYAADRDLISDGLNAAPNVSVTLQLVDAAWVAANRR